GLVGLLERDDALAAPFLDPVVRQLGPLAEALLAHDQQGRVPADHHHADDLVALFELDALDPGGVPSHLAHVALVEPDAHAVAGGQDDVAVGVADLDVDQLVALLDVYGPNAAGADVSVGGQQRLLHRALARGHAHALFRR